MKKLLCIIFTIIPAVLVSCATTVRFDAVHTPIVDLRGVNTITVIPFERDSSGSLNRLSTHVTSALTTGIRNNIRTGNISFVEPQTLEEIPEWDLWQYVDVYVTGRITGVRPNIITQQTSRIIGGETVYTVIFTYTVTVDIEYSYIRARNSTILSTIIKSETAAETDSIERRQQGSGNRDQQGNRSGRGGQRNNPANFDQEDPNQDRGRRGRPRESWEERIAISAINGFSLTMRREFAPWTTTEERNLKNRKRHGQVPNEAGKLVRAGKYDQALRIYQDIYRQNGNIYSGFNAAILLAAGKKFAEAHALLEDVQIKLLTSGTKTPRFIGREIQRMAGYAEGFKMLEERNNSAPSTATLNTTTGLNVTTTIKDEPANTREVRGTLNLNLARVYALSEPISHIEDNSIWSKIVTSTDAMLLERQWFMRIPDSAPSMLWFLVIDGRNNFYITQTALSISETVVLNPAEMNKLE